MKFNIYKFEEDKLKGLSSFFINDILKRKKQSTHKEQILTRPDTYIGSIEPNEEKVWTYVAPEIEDETGEDLGYMQQKTLDTVHLIITIMMVMNLKVH